MPADQSTQQATSLPSTPKDQISGLQQKDAVEGSLKYYLDLEKEPYSEERKQDTQLVSYLDYTVENDFCCLGLCAQCGGSQGSKFTFMSSCPWGNHKTWFGCP